MAVQTGVLNKSTIIMLLQTVSINILLANLNTVSAELYVAPLWNVTSYQNGSDFCFINTGSVDKQNMTVFNGAASQTCSVYLTMFDNATLTRMSLQIPQETILYVERLGQLQNCQKNYALFEKSDEPCDIVFRHKELRLFLHGNTEVFMSGISVEKFTAICPMKDELEYLGVSQTNPCPLVEYDHQLSCNWYYDIFCTFEVAPECNTTLGYREIMFQCNDFQLNRRVSMKSMFIYPTGTSGLFLVQKNIKEINENHFTGTTDLETIYLDNNRLTSLHPYVFANLISLTFLSLRSNRLVSINIAVFSNLKQLRVLSLGDNEIETLEMEIFRGLMNLVRLHLDGNKLETLHRDLFLDLNSLTELYLYGNELRELPGEVFSSLTDLKELDLDNNKLITLDNDLFKGLHNLEILWINRNQLIELDAGMFSGNNRLTTLRLNDNKLTDLPTGLFRGLNNLESIYLEKNKLISLDETLFNETNNLVYLNLKQNNLRVLPSRLFEGLSQLYSLDLSKNFLVTLEEHLFDANEGDEIALTSSYSLTYRLFTGLSNLKVLNLYENQIASLDKDSFNDTTNLAFLSLANNTLTTLPKGLFRSLKFNSNIYLQLNQIISLDEDLFNNTSWLYYLSLSYNRLEELPPKLFHGLFNLHYLYLTGNNLTIFPDELFKGLNNLEYLWLSENQIISLNENLFQDTSLVYLGLDYNMLTYLPNQIFRGMYDLGELYLYRNQLVALDETLLQDLHNLRVILLNRNNLSDLSNNLFKSVQKLEMLDLSFNRLTSLSSKLFVYLRNLTILVVTDNQLQTLDNDLFQEMIRLTFLDLSSNNLKDIPDISALNKLYFLDIKHNMLTGITRKTFSSLANKTEITVSQEEICECYVQSMITCTALDVRSPYLTCDRLLSDRVLVAMMWLIGLNAIGGNIFVLGWRIISKEKFTVQSFLLSNLAMSDLLMGIYMLLIASADIYFGENFPMQAETWRSGVTCKTAGTISILSSEASVFFITLISIDRFINMKYPFSNRKLAKKSTIAIVALLWLISLVLAAVPSFLAGIDQKFYDNSHVCIGLPLAKIEMFTKSQTNEDVCPDKIFCYFKRLVESKSLGRVSGMYFATAMFLGLNCICYLLIMFSYVEIVRAALKSSRRTGNNPEMKEQIRMTINVAAIVLTDFFCWFPIIILGILVQAGALTLPPSVFAWCVTFVLPINSAINPYLYTISHAVSNRRKQTKKGKSSGSGTKSSQLTNKNKTSSKD